MTNFVWTKPAADAFAPETAAGKARGAAMGDALRWGTEIETAIAALEARVASLPTNPISAWMALHS